MAQYFPTLLLLSMDDTDHVPEVLWAYIRFELSFL